ncbi:zf-TFIIB domain-containing protein [Brumicola blandensis]|uniref:Zf-TFIIB domain-containing protein n=1 Tax=Brumicola blandensis TaxID=3075611 RepID=A0AAW8R326_9ALTE|nr:zf-TFIIB domain-containing protein [Alteromonas sp. W409]MDT0581533.1 zf-TFIIB domain-containing protein [Alteromonas sp. W409]
MNCPKCDSQLLTHTHSNVEFERCEGCNGLWFDLLEKEDLQAIEGSEFIDIGDENVGKKHDANRNIKCPKCEIAMMQMIDKNQFHIHYEYCSRCHGTFFDAGEFRDLKEFTVIERFTQMLATLRANIN